MARVIKPPAPLALAEGERSEFLAGSIEMGRAEAWQATVEQALADLDVALLNPRRDEWGRLLGAVDRQPAVPRAGGMGTGGAGAGVIGRHALRSVPRAPVTLLELGLMARSGKLLVCCPTGFWRRGNVEVVCARHGVSLIEDLAELVQTIRRRNGRFLLKRRRRGEFLLPSCLPIRLRSLGMATKGR